MFSFVTPFRSQFKPLLENDWRGRAESMEAVFRYLESLTRPEYLIVETGCVRQDDWIDGRSTVLFDQFLQFHPGRLFSVDIDPDRCAYARTQVSDRTTVVNEDSVSFLYRFARELVGERKGTGTSQSATIAGGAENRSEPVPFLSSKIDLLYLDSMDVDWNDPHPSALHHLMELTAAMPALRSGSLVVVDDHLDLENRPGKSEYIVPFMAAIGVRKLFEAYQIAWIMP